jgi:hypothetical protein
MRNCSTTRHSLGTIPHNIIWHLSITRREDIEQDTEEEEDPKEEEDEVENQWYVTIVNNQDIMQGNVCFHRQIVCIFVHQTMIRRNV